MNGIEFANEVERNLATKYFKTYLSPGAVETYLKLWRPFNNIRSLDQLLEIYKKGANVDEYAILDED